MSNTMIQFKELISEIDNLRNKEKMIIQNFEKSAGELAGCFHWILKAKLEGRDSCCLSVNTCTELYANKLQEMGFEIEEIRHDIKNTIRGYYVKWK